MSTMLFAFLLAVTDMELKAPVLKTVETATSGRAELLCADAQGWTFDVSSSVDDGRDVVTVKLASSVEKLPPKFGVYFRVPGEGVQNVWTVNNTRDGYHLRPKLWWKGPAHDTAALAQDMPLAVGFNSTGLPKHAIACSEPFECVWYGLYADDETCDIIGRCEFFTQPTAPRKAYSVKVIFDRRGRPWYEVVRGLSDWIVAVNGLKPMAVPEAAYDPLYSTWYAYLQDVHAKPLEEEARLAAKYGMKTMILDDGWQKEESKTFYSAVGDWMPVKSRFPDMKAHVDAVHRAGLKYMLWMGLSGMGDESKAWAKFHDKLLRKYEHSGDLDPRFPEVRAHLIGVCERVVGEWGFDGMKLDFIDSFTLPEEDPALKDNYAGRDYRSLPEAVDRLMTDIRTRLTALKPDVLIEFRQRYLGPAMRQYGNMMRAADCPADPCANRKRVTDLRLTSGRTAVHSDMLVWGRGETPEDAALPILNVLYSTIQYSMILAKVRPEHGEVIRHWLDFSQKHREALLKGDFRPHHPENGYTWLEGESAKELVIASYAENALVTVRPTEKTVILVNATGTHSMLVELPKTPVSIRAHDVLGRPVALALPSAGISRLAVPMSGYLELQMK